MLLSACAVLQPPACHGAVYLPASPPRGWNSYDSEPAGTNESHVLAVATLLSGAGYAGSGYQYVTLDAGWFGDIKVDAYGRPLPDSDAYPSAAAGASFKPLATAIHSMGQADLRLGLWYMAGIPAATFAANNPIKGTDYRARDLALNVTYCPRWDRSWGYAVNHSHPAAQPWYDSLVELWDEWDIDMVKVGAVLPPHAYRDTHTFTTDSSMCCPSRPMLRNSSLPPKLIVRCTSTRF